MVTKFIPEANKIYFINQYSLFHILNGSGGIEVDFKAYHNWDDKIIFLDKGQYIKFLTEGFIVRKIVFEDKDVFLNKDVRVLFKHLVGLGYINFDECDECKKYLSNSVFSDQVSDIIDVSSKQWYWQNPFHANKEEYQVIFDVKEVIDAQFKNHISNEQLTKLVNQRGLNAQSLFKSKVGLTLKSFAGKRRLLESRREIAFSDKSIKEIGYDLGYKDPAYFNRVFKQATGQSPKQFRSEFEHEGTDMFVQDIYQLLDDHHQEQRSVDFYASKMHMSVKTLSKKVKDKLNISIGQLIRMEIINSAKNLLNNDVKINEVAYQLGFEEANHFSAFFKHYTNTSPSQYKSKKYKQ